VSNNIFNQVLSVNILHDLSVQSTRLSEVTVGVLRSISLNKSGNLVRSNAELGILERTTEAVRLVVGSVSLVSVNNHESISNSVLDSDSVGAVDGDLVIVSSQSVSVGIRIGEESSLEHLISRGFNTWDHVRGREGGLFDISEVVLRISVQDHLTNFLQGIVTMGPDLGNIENVPFVVGSISFRHDLDIHGPGGRFSRFNVLKEISGGIVRIIRFQLMSLFISEVLDSSISLEVELDVEDFSLGINPLEGVRSISIHVSVAIRSTSVREEDGDLVAGFRNEGKEIPEHIGVLAVSLRISLLCVDEIGELGRISDEEDGSVVSNHIVVTFFSVKLDSKTSRISFSISRSLLTTDSRESSKNRSSLSNSVQELSLGVFSDILGDFEITMGTSSLSVDNSFRNSFSVKVSKLVNQVEVLKEDWAVFTSSEGILVVINRSSVGSG